MIFRQFHQEGFVNRYAMAAQAKAHTVVFESEALENVPSGWKARETYELFSRMSSSRPSSLLRAPAPTRCTAGPASKRVPKP